MLLPKILRRTGFLTILAALAITAWSCKDNNTMTGPDYSSVPAPYDTTGAQHIALYNGLFYYQLDEGYGDIEANERDYVQVYYTMRYKSSGEIYSSSYANQNTDPVSIRLGSSQTPIGISKGIAGMKKGGKRTIIIPPAMSFSGVSDTLVYDVKLADILL